MSNMGSRVYKCVGCVGAEWGLLITYFVEALLPLFLGAVGRDPDGSRAELHWERVEWVRRIRSPFVVWYREAHLKILVLLLCA